MRHSVDHEGALPPAGRGTAVERAGARPPGARLTRPLGRGGPESAAWGLGADLRAYARILREQWWLVLGALVLLTAGVAAGSLSKPRVYRATAVLEIRRQAAEVVPVESFSQFERISDQYLHTQHAVLRGPAIIRIALGDRELAARMGGVAGLAPGRPGRGPVPAAEASTAALVAFVQNRLTIDPVATSRVVRVSVELEDPVLAADLVNAIVAAYLAAREQAGAATLTRLGEQADSVRSSVLAAEGRLQAFVRANGLGGVVVEGEGATVPLERLRRLQQELTGAEAEAYHAEAVAGVAAPGGSVIPESELLRTLRARMAELQGDYARLRSTFTDSFPRTRQVRSELTQLESLLAAEERRVVSTLAGQREAILRRRRLLEAAVNEQRLLMDSLSGKLAEYDRLQRDLAGQEQLYATLQQKRKEAAISAALSTMDVAVLDPAAPPLHPVRPLPKRDIPLAAVVGLVLGIGLGFLRHVTDVSVRTIEDMQGITSAPLLALIPAAPLPRGRGFSGVPGGRGSGEGWHRIDRSAPALSALEEAFSGLRTSMLYDLRGRERSMLLVTSSQPGEGKTTVSTNLAISLARLGRRVLLIDADLRRPSLHRVFAACGSAGLTGVLEGGLAWRAVVQEDVAPGLDLVAAGAPVANPADHLSSPGMIRLLREAERDYDFVVLDAPGLFMDAPDARILAHLVDGVILVVRSGVASREVVQRVAAQIGNLIGVVLNQMDLRSVPDYYRDYGRGGASAPAGARPEHLAQPVRVAGGGLHVSSVSNQPGEG